MSKGDGPLHSFSANEYWGRFSLLILSIEDRRIVNSLRAMELDSSDFLCNVTI